MKHLLAGIACALALTACWGIPNGAGSPPSSDPPPSGSSAIEDDAQNVTVPAELVGLPDRIYVVKNGKETVFEPQTDAYDEILGIARGRFPEALKEAALAIPQTDDGDFGWEQISGECDFLRLQYDAARTVKMNCMNENYKDFPIKEITFSDMVFPLTGGHLKVCMVGPRNTFGPLDGSPKVLEKLLDYAGS